MDRPFELSPTLRGCWPIAALVAAMPMIACGPPGPGDESFRVTRVDFDGDDKLTLTFTQPIANAGQIDPNDFRISLGRTYRVIYDGPYVDNPETYEGSTYADLAGYTYGYGYGYGQFTFMSASLGSSSDQLVLEMTTPLGTNVCNMIEYYLANFAMYLENYPGSVFDMGMFVHYAGQGIPLESDRGETLADVGRDWVLTDQFYMETPNFGFPKLNPRLQIPCP